MILTVLAWIVLFLAAEAFLLLLSAVIVEVASGGHSVVFVDAVIFWLILNAFIFAGLAINWAWDVVT